MGRFFWIIIGLGGLLLITLIVSGDTGKAFGIDVDTFGYAAVTGLWGLLIGSAVLSRNISFRESLKQAAIWCLIILGLMTVYVFRFDLQDVASRITGGLVPGSPISTAQDNGKTQVTLIRSQNGHFEAVADVNDASVRFLVDTGASAIVLSAQDARAAGIDISQLSFTIPTQTANGIGYSARTRIDKLYLGGIERKNLRVMVLQEGKLSQSLLGQQFLESLSSYEKRGDQLTLRD